MYDTGLPAYVIDRPKSFQRHVIKNWTTSQDITYNKIEFSERNCYLVNSSSREKIVHSVIIRSEDSQMPSCTCESFRDSNIICKHFCAIFTHRPEVSWNGLPDAYKESPYFRIDTFACVHFYSENANSLPINEPPLSVVNTHLESCVFQETEIPDTESDSIVDIPLTKNMFFDQSEPAVISSSPIQRTNKSKSEISHYDVIQDFEKLRDVKYEVVETLDQSVLDEMSFYLKSAFELYEAQLRKVFVSELPKGVKRIGCSNNSFRKKKCLPSSVSENIKRLPIKNKKPQTGAMRSKFYKPTTIPIAFQVNLDNEQVRSNEETLGLSEIETGVTPHITHTLTETDLKELCDGNILISDAIINSAQKKLKLQYSHIHGFSNVVHLLTAAISSCDDNEFGLNEGKFVQILFNGINHWVCLSNVFSSESEVFMYDSIRNANSFTNPCIRKQVAFCIKGNVEIINIPVQAQIGGMDCGAFAIANAVSLCCNINPDSKSYNQSMMRNHLHSCLSQSERELTQFP